MARKEGQKKLKSMYANLQNYAVALNDNLDATVRVKKTKPNKGKKVALR